MGMKSQQRQGATTALHILYYHLTICITIQCIHTLKKKCISCLVVFNSLKSNGLQPVRLRCPWNSPGKNTGMGSHSLLRGIFPTQGLNPGLLHCRKIIYHLSNQGSILLLPFNLNTIYMLYSNKNMFLIFKKRFKMISGHKC